MKELPAKDAAEQDVFTGWRRLMCYTRRPGVCKAIKRQYRKRCRRVAKRVMAAYSATVAALLLSACPAPHIPNPPRPPATDATCADVCGHWRDLGCHEAAPSPDGAPCETLCTIMGDTWDMACMATVSSCADIEDC